MDPLAGAALALALAAGVNLLLAWLIGVQGRLSLINNYRRHPEEFPDGEGLGRWIAWTLAAGGASFGFAALALAAGVLPALGVAPWAGATGVAITVLVLRGVARYRRKPGARRRP